MLRTLVFVGCLAAHGFCAHLLPAEDAIRPAEGNPRYWQYRGRPLLLLGGSIEDNLFQIPNLQEHLDLLQRAGGNYIRNTMSSRDPGNVWPFVQLDDARYDLSQPNAEYWRRFATLLSLAQQRDIIVQIELWDRFDFAREPWEANPYNPANNINYTGEESGLESAYPDHPGGNANPFFRSVPELDNNQTLLQFQHAQVEWMLAISLDYPNVLYCMDNETSGRAEWGGYWADYLRRRAAEHGTQVFLTEMWDAWDLTDEMHNHTFDHPERYAFVDISQNNHQRGEQHWNHMQRQRQRIAAQPRPMNNVKIYGADGGRYGSSRDGAERFWRNVLGGMASARFHRPDSGLGLSPAAQAHIQSARMLTDACDWFASQPHNELMEDREENEAYLSAAPGRHYVLYFPDGGQVTLPLPAAESPWRLRWLEIERSRWSEPTALPGERAVALSPPGGGHWAAAIDIAPHRDAVQQNESSVSQVPPELKLTISGPIDAELAPVAGRLAALFYACYPNLIARFEDASRPAPRHVRLVFQEGLQPPAYASGETVTVSTDWLRRHPQDIGLLTHELTHLVQAYPNPDPGWFTEGLADYARALYGPEEQPGWELPPRLTAEQSYRDSYRTSARFLQWLESQHAGVLDELHRRMQRQQFAAGDVVALTGKSLDAWWQECVQELAETAD